MTRTTTTKGGRRPDADVFAEARHALDRASTFPATVRVHVRGGTATLTGTVRTASESANAAEVVQHVRGVERVVNSISVAQPPSEKGFEPPTGAP
jgi:osmotically-inducible protein OsmY